MTSGQFHSISIEQITVPPRQRRDLGDISNLKSSIRRLGQIHPVLVTRDFVLVAGRRRLQAIRELGHDQINCQYQDEVDEFTLQKIELEENIKRLDIEWQDECRAVVRYHAMNLARDPEWNQDKTADDIGIDQQDVSDNLLVHEEGKRTPDIWKEPNFSTALRRARVNKYRRDKAVRQTVAEVVEGLNGSTHDEAEKPKDKNIIIVADFCEWAETYTGPKFNFLHCDFPYGINTDKRQQGNAIAVHGGYDDSAETHWCLLEALCANLDRICAESAHIMFWFSMHRYQATLEHFAKHSDFKIDPFPLLWVKDDKRGIVPDAMRGPRRIYETCLFGSRGDHKIITPVANAYFCAIDGSGHSSAKPQDMLSHFFRMFVDETSRVLDPTCGSGTALRAAESLGAAQILGIEINEEFADRATIALEESRAVAVG
jgi:ParB family transcriptional regulator, chromosome partitioning protein